MPRAFIAVYTGASVASARLVAATADPDLVAYVASRLLREPPHVDDAAVAALDSGRKRALRLVRQEASRGRDE